MPIPSHGSAYDSDTDASHQGVFSTTALAALTPSRTSSCQIPWVGGTFLHGFNCPGVGYEPSGVIAFATIAVSLIPWFVFHAISFHYRPTRVHVGHPLSSSRYHYLSHRRAWIFVWYSLQESLYLRSQYIINKFSFSPFSYSPAMSCEIKCDYLCI